MKQKSQLYEGLYIINARLSEGAREKAIERIQKGIVDRGGEILKIHDQGRKRLAYEIEGNREGHYVLLYFKAPTSLIDQVWKEYQLNEDLLRFMTLRAEEVMEKIEFKPIVELE